MLKLNRHSPKISQAIESLARYGISTPLRQQLTTFFQTAEPRQLYHANPRAIADSLNLTLRETLHLLIFALKEGLVTLNWDFECQACGFVNFIGTQLSDLRTYHTCACCKSVELANADERVRVTFSLEERLRRLGTQANDPEYRAQIDTKYGIVSGHQLLTLQTFRNLFPRETIPPNESLTIQRVAILFTDLTGSTALYSRLGDSRAYHLVHRHFGLLFDIVDAHNGIVVKTIGDAIMAAFTEPMDALKAAIAMHEQINALNQQLALTDSDRLILKIGIHAGPCVSVTLNDRFDYFGTTVNTAARVQATSQGNDIVVTDDFLADRAAAAVAETYPNRYCQLSLKGLSDPVGVHCIQLKTLVFAG